MEAQVLGRFLALAWEGIDLADLNHDASSCFRLFDSSIEDLGLFVAKIAAVFNQLQKDLKLVVLLPAALWKGPLGVECFHSFGMLAWSRIVR